MGILLLFLAFGAPLIGGVLLFFLVCVLCAPFVGLYYLVDIFCMHVGLPQTPFVNGLVSSIILYPLGSWLFRAVPMAGPKPVSLEQQREWAREADKIRALALNGTIV